MAITRAQQARQMLKKGSEPVEQAGVMNYMPSEMVTVPKIAKSSPDTPTAKLAYITPEEENILVDLNLYGSLKGKPNKGPGGIPSLEGDFGGGFGGFKGGGDYSAAERGDKDAFGKSPEARKEAQDIRSSVIAAGAGQRVNPGFFDSRNVVSPGELAAARAFAKKDLFGRGAFRATRGGPLKNFISTGGILGNLIRRVGQKFGLGQKFNQPTYDMSIGNKLGLFGEMPEDSEDEKISLESFITPDNTTSNVTNVEDDDFSDIENQTAFLNDLGLIQMRNLEKKKAMEEYGGAEFTNEDQRKLDELQRRNRDATTTYGPLLVAEGGRIGAMGGGIMDIETARQMLFIGGLVKSAKKAVKSATKAVKKIAKSPIGKAALIGAAGFGIPGTSFGGLLGRASFGGAAKGLFGTYGPVSALKNLGIMKSVSDAGAAATRTGPLASLISNFPGGGIGAAITAASVLPLLGIGTGDESEEEAEELLRGEGLDIAAIRANPNKFLARRFVADGGRIEYQEGSKEPVAKKTMPLLDMGGKEMDLREEGGFVPIGRMEKADDVPARLSKNEFVFTADAVRNAGDGNVDKGAEVMYNMMKNLESGGDVSEESQGLEGARKMFQTSQRLEEVL